MFEHRPLVEDRQTQIFLAENTPAVHSILWFCQKCFAQCANHNSAGKFFKQGWSVDAGVRPLSVLLALVPTPGFPQSEHSPQLPQLLPPPLAPHLWLPLVTLPTPGSPSPCSTLRPLSPTPWFSQPWPCTPGIPSLPNPS